jgi:hypothetical protein
MKTSRRVTWALLATIVALSLPSVGCGSSVSSVKELNESNAVGLLKNRLEKEHFKIQVEGIANLFKESLKNYGVVDAQNKQETVLKRLLDKGLVIQTTRSVNYPKISGTFANDNTPTGRREYRLEMLPGSNLLTGRYLQQNSTYDLKANGSVQPDGKMEVDIGFGVQTMVYHEQGSSAYLEVPGGTWGNFNGSATGKTVTVNLYSYSWAPDFQKQLVQDANTVCVLVGKFDVGVVSNLRLVTETEATATFKWKAALNSIGKIVFPMQPPEGLGEATFGKKPDGTWFVDQWKIEN